MTDDQKPKEGLQEYVEKRNAADALLAEQREADRQARLKVFEVVHPLEDWEAPEGPEWISHDDFEIRNARRIEEMQAKGEAQGKQSVQENAKADEDRRLREYLALGGEKSKYVPRRQFPCPGTLRVIEKDYVATSKPVAVRCDTCGFTVTIPGVAMSPGQVAVRRLERVGIPAAFRGKPMDPVTGQEQVRAVFRDYIQQWGKFDSDPVQRLPAPSVFGRPGVGKTHLLCLTVEAIVRHYSAEALYFSLRTLLDRVKDEFDGKGGGNTWKRALGVQLLVLDDIGAERPTEWAQDRFAELVDYRYSNELPIILASNIPPSDWPESFGPRTASRLQGMTLTRELKGPDQRELRRPDATATAPLPGQPAQQTLGSSDGPSAPPAPPLPVPPVPPTAEQDAQPASRMFHGLGPAEPTQITNMPAGHFDPVKGRFVT